MSFGIHIAILMLAKHVFIPVCRTHGIMYNAEEREKERGKVSILHGVSESNQISQFYNLT